MKDEDRFKYQNVKNNDEYQTTETYFFYKIFNSFYKNVRFRRIYHIRYVSGHKMVYLQNDIFE